MFVSLRLADFHPRARRLLVRNPPPRHIHFLLNRDLSIRTISLYQPHEHNLDNRLQFRGRCPAVSAEIGGTLGGVLRSYLCDTVSIGKVLTFVTEERSAALCSCLPIGTA